MAGHRCAHCERPGQRETTPASGRISNRFLIARTRRVWKLVRPTASVNEAAGAPELEPISTTALAEFPWASTLNETAGPHHALRRAAASSVRRHGLHRGGIRGVWPLRDRASTGRHAPADANSRKRLLNGAAALAHEAGLTGLVIHVDSDDAAWVNVCRLVNFQHDRTDVLLQLGGHR